MRDRPIHHSTQIKNWSSQKHLPNTQWDSRKHNNIVNSSVCFFFIATVQRHHHPCWTSIHTNGRCLQYRLRCLLWAPRQFSRREATVSKLGDIVPQTATAVFGGARSLEGKRLQQSLALQFLRQTASAADKLTVWIRLCQQSAAALRLTIWIRLC